MSDRKYISFSSLPPGETIDLFHQFEDFHSSLWYTFFLVSDKLHIHSRRSNTRNEKTPLYKQKLRIALQLPQYYDIKLEHNCTQRIIGILEKHFQNLQSHHYQFEQLLRACIEDVIMENIRGYYFLGLEKDKSFELKSADLASAYWLSPRKAYWIKKNGKALAYVAPKKSISMDRYVEGLLEESNTNGLNEIGYHSEDGSDVSSFRDTKTQVQEFIQRYASPSDYKRQQYEAIRSARNKLVDFELTLYKELGFQANPNFLYDYIIAASKPIEDSFYEGIQAEDDCPF